VESSADEPRVLLFKLSGGGSAKITLNEEHLAVEIVHEPADGPSLLIEYSSYLSPDEPPGPGRYPMFLHIKTQSGEADWDFKIDGIRRP